MGREGLKVCEVRTLPMTMNVPSVSMARLAVSPLSAASFSRNGFAIRSNSDWALRQIAERDQRRPQVVVAGVRIEDQKALGLHGPRHAIGGRLVEFGGPGQFVEAPLGMVHVEQGKHPRPRHKARTTNWSSAVAEPDPRSRFRAFSGAERLRYRTSCRSPSQIRCSHSFVSGHR